MLNFKVSLSSRTKRKGFYTNENLLYHIGQPSDPIVQPAFTMHCVVRYFVFQLQKFIYVLLSAKGIL